MPSTRPSRRIKALAWLLARRAIQSLPEDQQDRYCEEFCAELLEMTVARQILHSWRLLRSSSALAFVLQPTTRRRQRLLVPVAAAAAVFAITFSGIGLAARDAQPGDALWGLTKVLYAEHARSVEGAEAVRADLKEAQSALSDGAIAEAKSKLEDAHAALPFISGEDGKDELEAQHASLVAWLPGRP